MTGELSIELLVTAGVSALALLAVLGPFVRGLRLVLRARAATRLPEPESIAAALAGPERDGEAFAVLYARTFAAAREESPGEPTAFLRDAARQYVLNEYETHYAQPLSMVANLLPPLGFIGTTIGLGVLFVSMQLQDSQLQLGALGVALTSTIFALIGLAILEGLRIGVYARLLRSLEGRVEVAAAGEVPAEV